MVEVLPFLLLFPPSVPAQVVGRADEDVEWERAGMIHVGALRTPVLFVELQFLSISKLDGSPQKCVCKGGSLALGQRGNFKIDVVSPLYSRKEWKQLPKKCTQAPKEAFKRLLKLSQVISDLLKSTWELDNPNCIMPLEMTPKCAIPDTRTPL